MAIREGRWDCQYCGTLGNLGRHRHCANCNRSRPENTKFYLADDAEIADKRLEKQALIGPDWVCDYCGTSNAADITVCGSCGAPREESSKAQDVKEFGLDEVPTTGDMTLTEEPRESNSQSKDKEKTKKLPIIAIIGIAFLAILCLGAIGFLIFGGGNEEATVDRFQWERSIEIEAFQTVTEEDWELPAEARLLSQKDEIHHYDQVLDHYETRQRQVQEQVQVGTESYVCGQRDLGNGFFEDIECQRPVYETQSRTETYEEPIYVDVPVYQPLYTYDIDKWIAVRTEESSGSDHSPYWPRADLASDEREGESEETYIVFFADGDGQTYDWETTFDRWQRFEEGQKVILKFNALRELSEVELP